MFPGAQRKFKVYHERVSIEQHNIHVWEITIFLPADANLFKVITTDFEQTFACWIVTRQNLIQTIVLEQSTFIIQE